MDLFMECSNRKLTGNAFKVPTYSSSFSKHYAQNHLPHGLSIQNKGYSNTDQYKKNLHLSVKGQPQGNSRKYVSHFPVFYGNTFYRRRSW